MCIFVTHCKWLKIMFFLMSAVGSKFLLCPSESPWNEDAKIVIGLFCSSKASNTFRENQQNVFTKKLGFIDVLSTVYLKREVAFLLNFILLNLLCFFKTGLVFILYYLDKAYSLVHINESKLVWKKHFVDIWATDKPNTHFHILIPRAFTWACQIFTPNNQTSSQVNKHPKSSRDKIFPGQIFPSK